MTMLRGDESPPNASGDLFEERLRVQACACFRLTRIRPNYCAFKDAFFGSNPVQFDSRGARAIIPETLPEPGCRTIRKISPLCDKALSLLWINPPPPSYLSVAVERNEV